MTTHMRRLLFLAVVSACGAAVPAAAPSTDAPPTARAAVVVAVVAADTLDVRLEGGNRERIRLTGVAAPGVGSCFAKEAAAETRRRALGRRVTLIGAGTRAYVELPGRRDLGRLLVGGGFAQVAGSSFARFAVYAPAQQAADSENLGMWGRCAADLAVGVSGPAQAALGDRISYAATVRNRGPLTAPRVLL